jgi:predicted AAA+ superfamily ATPase
VEKGKLNIQVCYKLSTEDVERETKVFKKIEGEKILIYLNKDENLKINEDIKLISFEDFLLIL